MVSPLFRFLGSQALGDYDPEADDDKQQGNGHGRHEQYLLPPHGIQIPGPPGGPGVPSGHGLEDMDMPHQPVDQHREYDCSGNHTNQMGCDLNGVHKPPRPVDNLKKPGSLPVPLAGLFLQLPFIHILNCRTESIKHSLQKDKTNQYKYTDRRITIVHNTIKTPFVLMPPWFLSCKKQGNAP